MNPGAKTLFASAIVCALGSHFGSGNALVKMGATKPTWSDSVAFGCYRKEFLGQIGGFDERLLGSSDMDLNHRIRAAGGKILLVPEVVVEYFADATWKAFCKHNFADGVWATYVLKFRSGGWSWRHWIPLAFVISLLASLLLAVRVPAASWLFLVLMAAYMIVNFAVSARLAARERNPAMAALLPIVFAVRHFAHGIGAMFGLFLVALPGVHWRGRRTAKA